MELQEKAEEILEYLWINTSEAAKKSVTLAELETDDLELIEELASTGYIVFKDNNIRLTAAGRPFARSVVRRHRLAERLLADVLGTGESLMHEKACKFEHLLNQGLDESICGLLGHPKVCPHGKPIPPGPCCSQRRKKSQQVVSSLSQLDPGQNGKVAYIHAAKAEQLNKLTAMGILPGASVSLIQNFPSFVFNINQTQFAVDKEIADSIYIRLFNAQTDGGNESTYETESTRKRRGIARFFGLR